MTAVWTSPRIEVMEYHLELTAEQRVELRSFLDRHGLPAMGTIDVEYDVIDLPFIRATVLVWDDGRCWWATEGEDMVMATREIALREPLPDWWQPA